MKSLVESCVYYIYKGNVVKFSFPSYCNLYATLTEVQPKLYLRIEGRIFIITSTSSAARELAPRPPHPRNFSSPRSYQPRGAFRFDGAICYRELLLQAVAASLGRHIVYATQNIRARD